MVEETGNICSALVEKQVWKVKKEVQHKHFLKFRILWISVVGILRDRKWEDIFKEKAAAVDTDKGLP